MKKWLPLILLIFILLLSAFMRLYKISAYMTFLGDEGRDALVAKGILEGNLTLLGPRSSAGDFFMGPIYYYMMAPFLWLSHLDPVGPAIMVALFSVATTFLIYFVGKRFFTQQAGLFAAALYAVSPLVINFSHSSWNPDVVPFFALLLMYTTFKAIASTHQWRYFMLTGFLLGIGLQLHYLVLFLGVVVAVYTFFAEWLMNEKIKILSTIKHYLQIFVGFLIGFSPFIAFEVRHNFANTQSIMKFIFGDTVQQNSQGFMSFYAIVTDVFFRVFARLLFNFPASNHISEFSPASLSIWGVIAMVISIAAIVWLYFYKNKFVVMLLLMWLFIGVLLFGFYKKSIYDYYFVILFPLPFLIIGNFFSQFWQLFLQKKAVHISAIIVSVVLFFSLFAFNLAGRPFTQGPNYQKDQVRTISEFIIKQTDNKPYNFALIAQGNSDHAYRYYFSVLKHDPVQIQNPQVDPERKTVTGQLFVLCEDSACKPLGNPLFEIAGFGRAAIVKEWPVSIFKVYKLIPYTERQVN